MHTSLIDFSALFHRMWHVNREEAKHKCIGFVMDISQQSNVIICIDSPPYRRSEISETYKKNRSVPDPELIGTLRDTIKELSKYFQIASCDGWEADDVIASIIAAHENSQLDIEVHGVDKDLLQVCDLTVPFTGEIKTAETTLGINRNQVADYLSLVGDTSDNISGVVGVGPKTAVEMLNKFGDIDTIYAVAEKEPEVFKKSTHASLIESKGWIDKTRELVRLRTDLDVKISIPQSSVENISENISEDDREDDCEESNAKIIRRTDVDHSKALEPVDPRSAFQFAKLAYDAGLHQQYKSPQQALLAVMKGRNVGLDAVTSLESIHVINGKSSVKAEILVALVKRSSVCKYFTHVELSDSVATWETHRVGDPSPVRVSFTIDQARRMGLTGRDNWKKQPDVMLQWRSASKLARLVYPDITNGLYGIEEFE